MSEFKDQSNALVSKPEGYLEVMGRALAISEKALLPFRKEEAFDFCVRHKEFFIQLISQHYSFSFNFLNKISEWIKYNHLSNNNHVEWSFELLQRYADKLNWNLLSYNESLPWSIDLIRLFKNKWDWSRLSNRYKFQWPANSIDEFWEYLSLIPGKCTCANKTQTGISLSRNPDLPWSISFIDKYSNFWNWNCLSQNSGLPWGTELIDRYYDKWDWYGICRNTGIPWSIGLIERYSDKLLFSEKDDMDGLSASLSCNKSLPWTLELIEKYKERWNWSDLSHNRGLPWSAELVQKYVDKWDWKCLCWVDEITWTRNFIHEYETKISFEDLSRNKNVLWSEELVDEYLNRWDWNALSKNPSLPWSDRFVEKYEASWIWKPEAEQGSIFSYDSISANSKLPWSSKFIKKYEDKIDWQCLSKNFGVNWSVAILDDYWDLLNEDGGLISNKSVWDKVFKPVVDEQFIEKLFEQILQKSLSGKNTSGDISVLYCGDIQLAEIVCHVIEKYFDRYKFKINVVDANYDDIIDFIENNNCDMAIIEYNNVLFSKKHHIRSYRDRMLAVCSLIDQIEKSNANSKIVGFFGGGIDKDSWPENLINSGAHAVLPRPFAFNPFIRVVAEIMGWDFSHLPHQDKDEWNCSLRIPDDRDDEEMTILFSPEKGKIIKYAWLRAENKYVRKFGDHKL